MAPSLNKKYLEVLKPYEDAQNLHALANGGTALKQISFNNILVRPTKLSGLS